MTQVITHQRCLKTAIIVCQLVDLVEMKYETHIKKYPAPSLHKCGLAEHDEDMLRTHLKNTFNNGVMEKPSALTRIKNLYIVRAKYMANDIEYANQIKSLRGPNVPWNPATRALVSGRLGYVSLFIWQEGHSHNLNGRGCTLNRCVQKTT
jgi:hypothetical protein